MSARKKKCKICKKKFDPWNSLQKVCSPECAVILARSDIKKKEDREHREAKRKLNDTIKIWKPKAQKAFNEYVRERDKYEPCISCNTTNPTQYFRGGSWDCGHYRSVGACPELRFEEKNAYKQCKRCNSHMSSNHVEYRINLIKKFGIELVEWLEGPHEPKRYRLDDY